MAEGLIVDAIEIIEIVAEIFDIGEDVLTEIESTLSDVIENSINEGYSNAEALDAAYESIVNTEGLVDSQAVADQWAESMAEQGYEFESGTDAEEVDFEDTDPESDPNKGEEPDTTACVDEPEGEECLAQKQSKISKFIDFMKNNWKFLTFVVGVATIVVGALARGICWIVQKIKGQCTTDQCIDQQCDSNMCNAAKSTTQFIRTYWIYLILGCVMLGIAGTIYFKSMSYAVVFGIIGIALMVMKSALGNLVTTMVCDLGATTCLLTGHPINC